MNRADYRLATQSGGRGLFARVILSAALTNEQKGLNIIYENTEGTIWNSAVGFGVNYAYEQIFFDTSSFSGLTVKINEIIGTIVDTKEIAMVYVSAMAVWKALNIYPKELPIFDNEKRIFIFPE